MQIKDNLEILEEKLEIDYQLSKQGEGASATYYCS